MWSLIAIALLGVDPIEVTVRPLEGETVSGTITDLSSDTLALKTASGDQMLKIRSLLAVEPSNPPERSLEKPQVWVELIDGSKLVGHSYQVSGASATIELMGDLKVKVPTRDIRCVLLKTHENLPELDKQWQEIKNSKRSGDTIVIRQETKEKGKDDDAEAGKTIRSLDSLDGLLRDISAENIQFDFEGSRVDVKRVRVEGIIYYHPPGRDLPDAVCRLVDADGSAWNVKSLAFSDEKVEFVSTSGTRAAVHLARIAKFDFTAGNTVYLSDLKPAAIEWKPFFAFGGGASKLATLYRPRMDRAFDGGKLKLYSKTGLNAASPKPSEVSFDKGIAVHSRTTLEYLLPGKFKHLMAKVGIDPRVRQRGNARVVISGDRKTLFDKVVTGGDDEPIDLDLNVAGVERLTVLIDFGEETDIADHVNLCNARLTK